MFSIVGLNLLLMVVFSLFIIVSVHYAWNYLKDNYTEKKTKDLVNIQTEKYKKIIEELQKPSNIVSIEEPSSQRTFLNEEEKTLLSNDLFSLVDSLSMASPETYM